MRQIVSIQDNTHGEVLTGRAVRMLLLAALIPLQAAWLAGLAWVAVTAVTWVSAG